MRVECWIHTPEASTNWTGELGAVEQALIDRGTPIDIAAAMAIQVADGMQTNTEYTCEAWSYRADAKRLSQPLLDD